MELIPPLSTFLRENNDVIVLVLIGVAVLELLLIVAAFVKMRRLNRRYANLTVGSEGTSIEQVVREYMKSIDAAGQRMQSIDQNFAKQSELQTRFLQKVGMVRFDAFDDVGGQQSFAVAILDGQHSGIVLSSVHSRADVRVYAKAIRNGQPSHTLTREEEMAMAQAEGKQ